MKLKIHIVSLPVCNKNTNTIGSVSVNSNELLTARASDKDALNLLTFFSGLQKLYLPNYAVLIF